MSMVLGAFLKERFRPSDSSIKRQAARQFAAVQFV